mgnify:CR=1 FL=1
MHAGFDKLVADWKRQKRNRKTHSEMIRRRICEKGENLSYSFELDWEKERAVAVKLPETAVMLRRQMIQFIESLSSLEA